MTQKDKRLALIAGTVILAVLLFLLLRRGGTAGGNTVVQQSPFTLPAVYGPNIGPIYNAGNLPFNIPGLNLNGPDLSMIGACCSDCMQSQQFMTPTYAPGNTYVFNEGNAGPNVFNYYTPAPVQQSSYTPQFSQMGA